VAESTESSWNLAVEISKEIHLHKIAPRAPSPASPLKIGLAGKITVVGTVSPPEAKAKVAFGKGKMEVTEEAETEFGKVEFTQEIKPGHVSSLKVGIARSDIPVTIELAANLDYREPLTFSVKWPKKIEFKGKGFTFESLGLQGYTFTGTLAPELEVILAMNEAWLGWRNILRLMAQRSAGAYQTGVAAIRGVYYAGELGTVSTIGATAIGVGVALFGVAWVSFGLYCCGKALRDGRAVAIRYNFSNGYARMLADLTIMSPAERMETSSSEAATLLAIPWKSELTRLGSQYLNGASVEIGDEITRLGKAAVLQDVDVFIKSKGVRAWDAVKVSQCQRYGQQYQTRRQAYISVLYDQVYHGRDTLGVSLT
jgi:hypothetical protein